MTQQLERRQEERGLTAFRLDALRGAPNLVVSRSPEWEALARRHPVNLLLEKRIEVVTL